MKKYGWVAVATMFMFSVVVMGQDQMHPRGEKDSRKEFKRGERPQLSPQKRAEKMAKVLQLTDLEKAKVQSLMERQDEKMKQHQLEIKQLREEQKMKFQAERKAHDEELQSIIGKEKFEKFQSIRMEHLKKMKHRKCCDSTDDRCEKK
jgi:hypothetical protein